MDSAKDPERGDVVEGQPVGYGTFEGDPNFPQPVPHSEAPQGISEGRPLFGGEHYQQGNLPCCNLGWGWFLFVMGFLLGFPWFIGTVVFFCVAYDRRERAGLKACAIAFLIFLILAGWNCWQEECLSGLR